jgi:DNA-binding response OmpR family regulator
MDVMNQKQVRHTDDLRRGYPARREESGVNVKTNSPTSVALLFIDGNDRKEKVRTLLSEDFSRVVVLRTMDEGIWTVRRIMANGEKIAFCLFDSSVPENEILGFIAFARGRGNLGNLPVLVMTEERDPDYRVRVLDAGADEVLAMPCPVRETVARIHSLMRRGVPSTHENLDAPARYEAGALVVDTDRHEVRWKGKRIFLTPLEFRILTRLVRNPGKVLSRDALMSQLWGEHWEVEDHNLSVHIHGLRKKFSDSAGPSTLIETVRGVGYRIQAENP